jgi:hypothetical protein
MRFSDLLFGFPAVLSAILITAVLGPSVVNAMLAIGIFYIPVFARLTRASALTVKGLDYITAARAAGHGEIDHHSTPCAAQHSFAADHPGHHSVCSGHLAEAGLSYLGLGTQPPHASWGRMLNEAQTFMELAPWMAIFPGMAIAWAVLGFNLLGRWAAGYLGSTALVFDLIWTLRVCGRKVNWWAGTSNFLLKFPSFARNLMIPKTALKKYSIGSMKEMIDLTARLVQCNSVWDPQVGTSEAEVAERVAQWAEKRGFEVDVEAVSPDRPNVIIRLDRRPRRTDPDVRRAYRCGHAR